MTPQEQSAEPRQKEPKVLRVTIWLCELCLEGKGEECHAPGCALFLHNSPGHPIHKEFYERVDDKDGERLDWLEANKWTHEYEDILCRIQAFSQLIWTDYGPKRSLRDAIDAALNQSEADSVSDVTKSDNASGVSSENTASLQPQANPKEEQ